MFVLSPQSHRHQIGQLAADGVGCEIRLALTHGMRSCWCEVAVGESAARRSPWELAPVMWRSRFAFAFITSSTSDTVYSTLQEKNNAFLVFL